MNRFLIVIIAFLVFVCIQPVFSQTSNATLYGVVTDNEGSPIELVNVAMLNYPFGTTTNRKGEFLLRIPTGREIVVAFSALGYEMAQITLNLSPDEITEYNLVLNSFDTEIDEVIVTHREQSSGNIMRLDPGAASAMPDIGMGSVESVLRTMPGVTASNELSNQYSVRGGSFDENLVYVNDIEVYRPYLIRAGQQEGLSFINPDMVSSIEFSAGGFDAKYGDKMSSVLDIRYRRPSEFSASAAVGLLGGKVHVENISSNGRFTYNMGVRYKTFRYLLRTLEEKGEYDPSFVDYQGYFTYKVSEKMEWSFLGTASSNKYNFIPQSKHTQSGIFNDQRSLYVHYEGQEIDRFLTYTGTLSLQYEPTRNSYYKLSAAAYTTREEETFDIIGYYRLNEVSNIGTSEQEDSTMNIGVGFYHEHGRNYLDADVFSVSHKGGIKLQSHFLQWGITAKQEYVHDRMNEWEYRDSAGYALPYSDADVLLYYSARTNYSHAEQRATAFLQNSYTIPLSIGAMMLTGGVRAHYWTYTDKISLSPRFSASLATGVERDILFRLSMGMYQQPAFYREIKDLYGNINPDIQTPRSIHAVAGFDYSFIGWDRPFRLTFETYYKALRDLIPYQIENVRVRYLSNQISNGYAYGADFKINGEFVSGTQSWISMSLMKTEENIVGDGHAYIPRPADQRFKFSMYFQDYLPGLPQYQMHLTGHYITGAPYGMPRSPRHTQTARIDSYRRVDIGFTRLLVSNGQNLTQANFFERFSDFDVSLEVFNLMDIQNVASYNFISDFENNYHAIPNRLTGITFNLKVSATF